MGSSFADMRKQVVAFCDVRVAQSGVPKVVRTSETATCILRIPIPFQAEGIDVSRSGCRGYGFKGLASGLRIDGRCSNCSRL